jgi:hypothetical protein
VPEVVDKPEKGNNLTEADLSLSSITTRLLDTKRIGVNSVSKAGVGNDGKLLKEEAHLTVTNSVEHSKKNHQLDTTETHFSKRRRTSELGHVKLEKSHVLTPLENALGMNIKINQPERN